VSVIAFALLGAIGGGGLWLAASGVSRARPRLADVLAEMDVAPATPLASPSSLDERLGRLLGRALGRRSPSGGGRAADLAMLEIAPSTFLGSRVVAGLSGLAVGPALAVATALVGHPPAWQVPAVAALGLGALGSVIPALDLHARAEAQRRSFRRGLSGFLDVTALALASGELISGALGLAARSGEGWVFALLRATLADADQRGVTPWDAMGRAAEERGLDELGEVAASVRLAGMDGAHIRRTLAAKADGLRDRALADTQAEANEATSRMVLPLVGVATGFLVLIGYPAISHILGGH